MRLVAAHPFLGLTAFAFVGLTSAAALTRTPIQDPKKRNNNLIIIAGCIAMFNLCMDTCEEQVISNVIPQAVNTASRS